MEITTFEIAKEWLPIGCKLNVEKETSAQYISELEMDGTKTTVNLYKAVVPGKLEEYIKGTLACAMFRIYVDKNEWEKAKFWNKRIEDTKIWKKGDLNP